MDSLPALLGGTAALLSVVHIATAGISASRQRRREPDLQATCEVPKITVIRPLRGIEPFSHATLQSTFLLAPAAAEVLFCVERADDPIIPLAQRIMAAHPGVPSRLLIGRESISRNPKLNNLAKGWRLAAHEWIAFVDSNVLLPADALTALVGAFDDRAGMVCSPPAASAPVGFAARLECAFLNGHQARWQTTADTFGSGFAQGKTMFFHRSLLDDAGGLAALASEAAEDAAATKVVRARDLRVRLVNRFFEQPIGRRKFTDVFDRQVRWAKLRRASFPLHYALEILSGSVAPIAMIVAAAWLSDLPAIPIAIMAWMAWHVVESALVRWLDWPASLFHAMVRDILMPVIWCKAWLSNDFSWHGQDMSVSGGDADGGSAVPTSIDHPHGATR